MTTETIHTEYFSIDEPVCLNTITRYKTHIYKIKFEYGDFSVEIEIDFFFYGEGNYFTADRQSYKSFLDLFQNYWRWIKEKSLQVHQITIDDHEAYYVSYPWESNKENKTIEHSTLFIAFELSQYQYMTLGASYSKPSEQKTDEMAKKKLQNLIWDILNSIKINQATIDRETQRIEDKKRLYEETCHKVRQQHLALYRQDAEQTQDPFHARHYPEYFALLQQEMEKYPKLPAHSLQGIYNNAHLAIDFKLEKDDYSEKGNTRFYGLPDLPLHMDYPIIEDSELDDIDGTAEEGKHYLCKFVAQINFAELAGLQDYLPKKGILYFFINSQYYYGDGMSYPCKLFYYNGDSDSLQSAKQLKINPGEIFDVAEGYERKGGALPGKAIASAHVSVLENSNKSDSQTAIDFDYPPLIYDLSKKAAGALRKTFGSGKNAINARFIESDDGSPYIRAAQLYGGKPQDYFMLLKTEGIPKINQFMYEDADSLYFVIAKEKLKNLDFSQVYCSNTWWWRNGAGTDKAYW